MGSAHDVMPTLLEYVNLPIPTDRTLAGRSFSAILKGEKDTGRDRIVIYDEYGYVRMLRTQEWKYIHRYPDGPHELYDLVNDDDERNNLVDDPAQTDRIKDMKSQMEDWFSQYVIADKNGREYNVTGSGQLRPVGQKWENGEEPFIQPVNLYSKPNEG